MREVKQYEFLKSLPAYGPMYIPISENGELFYSEGIAVRFYKKDGTNWVGNFAPGSKQLTEIVTLNNCPYPLVIANGSCYLINPEYTQPIATFGGDYTHFYIASKNRCVLICSICLTIVEPDGSYWHTERISWDGLKTLHIENNIITGEAFSPTYETDKLPFSYDIDSRVLKAGSYPKHISTQKQWWKFW